MPGWASSGSRAIVRRVTARGGFLVIGIAVGVGCIGQLPGDGTGSGTPGAAGTGVAGTVGRGGAPGRGGIPGRGGTTGSAGSGGSAFGQPPCLSSVTKGGACTASDQQLCYKTCGPDKLGVKSETCVGGIYAEMSGCTFDASRDYSCYQIPSTASAACSMTPVAGTPCSFQPCTLCNSTAGLPGGTYSDSAGAPKLGYCVCSGPDAAGETRWSCASDTAWPCPLGVGCLGGRGGTTGAGGTMGGAGTSGSGGIAGAGGAAGPVSCTGLVTAAGIEPTKGLACVATDPPYCNKTCGPEKVGVRSEICMGGVYAETGCMFDGSKDSSCYRIPATANAACPAGVTPQASQECTVDHCVTCNSQGGLPGGTYMDSAGATRLGYCVCQPANAAGLRVWSCASDTAWPCPVGAGCNGTAGTGGGAGGSSGAGGMSGSFGQPACLDTVIRSTACLPTDQQLCYKTCGPEKTGVKSETCVGGVYAEMSGCAFDPTRDYSCYKIPSAANASCGAGVTPMAGTTCNVQHCTICNSTGGLPGGSYLDTGGAAKSGYCTCQEPNSAGMRTWTCASDTSWPCPVGFGC